MVRGSPSIQPPGAGPRVHTVFPSKFIHAWPTLTSMNEYDEQSSLHRMDLLNQHCSSGPIDKRNKTRERDQQEQRGIDLLMDSDNTRQNPGMPGRAGDRKHSPAIAEFLIPITKVFWRAKLSLRGPALPNKPQFSLCPCLGLGVEPNIYSSIHCLCWTSTRLLSHCSCFVF